jgi:formyltetrahydrofolate-dependent phosphoribosylglycinamide formyltransferase
MMVRVPTPDDPLRLAVLISGGGRTLVNLQQQISDKALPARISVVICSRSDAKGVQRARDLGLHTVVLERASLGQDEFQAQLTAAVADMDLVCMAGFLSFWRIPPEWFGAVINIHPALLPAFGGKGMYGMRVHEAVIEAGHRQSGCTVHFCDNEYDHGPIILQRSVALSADETPASLADKVFVEECAAYPEVISRFCRGEISFNNGVQPGRDHGRTGH